MYFLLKMVIFHCHVGFLEGKWCFGARWFRFRLDPPYKRDLLLKGTRFESRTTNWAPKHPLTIRAISTIRWVKSIASKKTNTWQFCWWPFGDGENVTLSKANRDLQRSGIKRSRIESPGLFRFPSVTPSSRWLPCYLNQKITSPQVSWPLKRSGVILRTKTEIIHPCVIQVHSPFGPTCKVYSRHPHVASTVY